MDGFRSSFTNAICAGIAGLCCLASTGIAQQQVAPAPAPNPTTVTQRLPQAPAAGPNSSAVSSQVAQASYNQLVRVKDITTIFGHRDHFVSGYGVVVGLQGTGSSSGLTQQVARNILRRANIEIANVPTKSMAFVAITGKVPAFHREGETFEVKVAAMDESVSLYGGEVKFGPLRTIDGEEVAWAAGSVILGGFSAQGESGGVFKNHVASGTCEATLEVELCDGVAFPRPDFDFVLRNKDYTTAVRIADGINQISPRSARALNSGTVRVNFPNQFLNKKMEYVSFLQKIRVQPDIAARVVVNQRTGTVLIGQRVRILPTVFAHTNLVITTTENPVVSQPNALSQGQTVVVPRTQIEAKEINSRYQTLPQYTTVGELATILNSLGITPRDFVSILRGLQAKGALQAELIFQ